MSTRRRACRESVLPQVSSRPVMASKAFGALDTAQGFGRGEDLQAGITRAPSGAVRAMVCTSAASAISGRLISSALMAAVLWSVRLSIREAGRVDVSATSTVSTEPSSLMARRFWSRRFLRTISRQDKAAVDIEFAVIADADNRSGDGQGFGGPDILAVLVDRVDAVGDFASGVPGYSASGSSLASQAVSSVSCSCSRAASSFASFAGERSRSGCIRCAVRPFGVILLKPELNPFPAFLAQTARRFFRVWREQESQKVLDRG